MVSERSDVVPALLQEVREEVRGPAAVKLQVVRRRRLQRRPELHLADVARLGAGLKQELPHAVDAAGQHAVDGALRLVEHQPLAVAVADAR